MSESCTLCDGKICNHCGCGKTCLNIDKNNAKCYDCGNTICWDCGKYMDECEYCGHQVCPRCEIIIRDDWLKINPRCDKCKRIACKWCLNVCYTCYNKGDNIEIVCQKCDDKIYRQFTCTIHGTWIYCDIHDERDIGCAECVYK